MYTNDEQEKRMMERTIERYKDVTTKINTISNHIANHPEDKDINEILDFILENLKDDQKFLIAYLTDNGINVEELDITESKMGLKKWQNKLGFKHDEIESPLEKGN